MNKTIIIVLGIMVSVIIGIGTIHACGGGPGSGDMMMGSGGGQHQTMYPGHMGHQGPEGGMPGHTGPDMSFHSGHHHSSKVQGTSVTEDQAKSLVENYLGSTRNPNLTLGTISENDNHFEAEIRTKEGSLVDRIRVDKSTGTLRSVYAD